MSRRSGQGKPKSERRPQPPLPEATPPPSRAMKAADRAEFALRARTIDGWFKLATRGITAVILLGLGYFVFKSVDAMSGKTTSFSSVINWLVDLRLSEVVSYVVAAGTTTAWYRERRLRQKTIAGTRVHVAHLEHVIDPQRTSSGLLPTGEPAKEDRDD